MTTEVYSSTGKVYVLRKTGGHSLYEEHESPLSLTDKEAIVTSAPGLPSERGLTVSARGPSEGGTVNEVLIPPGQESRMYGEKGFPLIRGS